MGCFSWKTCDTHVAIKIGSGAYLLQPNEYPIFEPCYGGYGEFSVVDAYEWLYDMNKQYLIDTIGKDKVCLLESYFESNEGYDREIGILLSYGYDYWLDKKTGTRYSFGGANTILSDAIAITGRPNDEMEGFDGQTPHELVKRGLWEKVHVSFELPYPLKFSNNPDARYEDFDASEIDPDQGYSDEEDYDPLYDEEIDFGDVK